MRWGRHTAVIAIVTALVASAAHAAEAPPEWRSDIAAAARALEHSALPAEERTRYSASLAAAARAVQTLPPLRARVLEKVLDQVAAHSQRLNRPRALTLFATLETNVSYLESHAPPRTGSDVEAEDGIVYRAFSDIGLQFHPLANAAKLNAHVSAGRDVEALALAEALVARAVWNGVGSVWEYWFQYGSMRAPWASGMAQAVTAQALARAAERLADPRLLQTARRAFAAVPRTLAIPLPEGLWIRLYSRLDLVVLNAQLQAALSVADYAAIAGDAEADSFAATLRGTAAALLPRFDTGAWSLYSLGSESSLDYQRYVVSLLKRLATTTGEPIWRESAERFERYETEPPLVNPGPVPAPIYPLPQDGHRDAAQIRLWVSKIGTATLLVGESHASFRVRRGWNTLEWRPPKDAEPGFHPVTATVVGLAGNESTIEVPPVEIRRDREPPAVTAGMRGRTLWWSAVDEGSARVSLTIVSVDRRLSLGSYRLSGSKKLQTALPTASHLIVADAAGNRVTVAL